MVLLSWKLTGILFLPSWMNIALPNFFCQVVADEIHITFTAADVLAIIYRRAYIFTRLKQIPAGIYLSKVSNGNTTAMFEFCSTLTIKTL